MTNKKSIIPNLDESVINALNFFKNRKNSFPKKVFSGMAFVVGSGNAYNIAEALFFSEKIILSNESNFKNTIKTYKSFIDKGIIKEALVISASGEKDSIWELKLAKKNGLKTTLFTCNKNSSAGKIADKVFLFDKITEPYTYNVSTYLGMIMAKEKVQSKKLLSLLKGLQFPENFANYKAYSFVLPDELSPVAKMLEIKRDELFGARISLRAFSEGQARHAKFVIPWEKELVISLKENKLFGIDNNRWEIKTKEKINFSLSIAICYYIIGKIQESSTPYFKNNIKNYCKKASLAYSKNQKFSVIVE